jgi:transposase
LYLRVGDGNETDSTVFARLIGEFKQQWDVDALFVADAALYTADNLKQMAKLRWVSRVPATFTLPSLARLTSDRNRRTQKTWQTPQRCRR